MRLRKNVLSCDDDILDRVLCTINKRYHTPTFQTRVMTRFRKKEIWEKKEVQELRESFLKNTLLQLPCPLEKTSPTLYHFQRNDLPGPCRLKLEKNTVSRGNTGEDGTLQSPDRRLYSHRQSSTLETSGRLPFGPWNGMS